MILTDLLVLGRNLNNTHSPSVVSATPGTSSMSKRPREEEETANMVPDTETTQDDNSRAPISKKLRIIQRVGPEVRKRHYIEIIKGSFILMT